jgi:ABC-type transport system involved in cytochrome c biogenesis permease subunit
MIKRLEIIVPIAVVVLALLVMIFTAIPRGGDEQEWPYDSFGALTVIHEGRVKPYDTLARDSLLLINESTTFKDDEGNKHQAIEWLFDVTFDRKRADQHKVIYIPNEDVREKLGLEARIDSKYKYRYSLNEIYPHWAEMIEEIRRIDGVKRADRDTYERQVVNLRGKMNQYMALLQWYEPHIVPPDGPDADLQTAQTVQQAGGADPFVQSQYQLLIAYAAQDHKRFAELIETRQANMAEKLGASYTSKASLEHFYNRYGAFTLCMVFYVFVFVLGIFSWLFWSTPAIEKPARYAALALVLMTFALHTIALAMRVYISGRAPVTNLYGSALFIGWGCVLLGLGVETIYRLGIGTVAAAIIGFLTLKISGNLAMSEGDTMGVLQAVLDTNFWLWTHVLCISFGYATTLFAGVVAILLVLLGIFTPMATESLRREMTRMIYGILCFATLFSFFGTVLGGLWADDSWGRFWGWDPKENGALMIVLWNALVLHARWAGLVQWRGLAALAIVGNIVTIWSWFGTNELGKGLHSYGFTEGRAESIFHFICIHLAFLALALLPIRFWASMREEDASDAKKDDKKSKSVEQTGSA